MPLEETLKKFKYLESNKIIGNLRRLLSFTDEPHFFQYSCSYSEDPYDEESNGIAIGLDEEKTKIRALGECIERYGLQNVPSKLIIDSFRAIGPGALDPAECVNFREEDMEGRKREEYIEKLRDAKISWVIGKDLQSGEEILIPAQLVYVPLDRKEPLIRSQISTGAASHESYEKAVVNGILEVIERDAFMLRYLSRDRVPTVRLYGKLEELKDYFKRYYLDIKVFDITTDIGIPSFMCINLDQTGVGPAVSVGLSSGFSSEDSILKSIIESQQVRQWVRYSYIQDGQPIIKNPSEIQSIKERGYYWYPTSRIKDMEFIEDGNKKSQSVGWINDSLRDLVNHLHNKGINSYAVDITPKNIRDSGFCIIKAILPELHPLFLYEDFPHLYSKRLENHLNRRELNPIPHPFM